MKDGHLVIQRQWQYERTKCQKCYFGTIHIWINGGRKFIIWQYQPRKTQNTYDAHWTGQLVGINWWAYVITQVVVIMLPNEHQAINNHIADLTMTIALPLSHKWLSWELRYRSGSLPFTQTKHSFGYNICLVYPHVSTPNELRWQN